MYGASKNIRATVFAVLAGLTLALFGPTTAAAQSYTQLQVLLPGETAAAGTTSGKLGTPVSQTVGISFDITVRACDVDWNTVTSVTNVAEITSSDVTASIPGSAALVNGTRTLTVTLNAAGSFTFSAEDQSDPTIPLATSANVTALALHSFEFNRINQKNQNAGVPMNITLTALDPAGDPVTGFSGDVRLQEITSFGDGRITPAIITMSNGNWSGAVTMYRADETSINRGNVNILASLDANPLINGTSDPFTVHPGIFSRVQIVLPGESAAPGSVSGVTGTPATQAAGQAFTVDIFATDAYWNPLPSADVVRVTSSDAAASTPVTGSMTNGFRQFTLSLGTVGAQTLTVNDQTNGSIQGMTSAGIMVIPSAPDHFEIDTIGSPVVAGSAVSVTIRAADVGGNTIPDYSGNGLLAANTGPGSISPESVVFTNGVWTGDIVFRGAGGAVSFSCSDFSTPPNFGTSNSFEVLPGPYTGLQVLLPGETPQGGTSSGVSGTPTDQNAGTAFSITIRAVDDFWNRVSGITNTIALSSSDAFADMPADTTLINGELSLPVILFKAGDQTITAADLDSTSINSHTSSTVTVFSGPYARILILAPGEEIAHGTAEGRTGEPTDQSINFSFTVDVYATDNWWNPVVGVSDVVRTTSGDPLAQLPPDTPLVDGQASMSIRLATGGFQQITVANVTQPLMPTSTTQVRAISSGFHLEAEVTPTTLKAGEPFTLTVKVTNDAGAVIQEINSLVSIAVQNASTEEAGRGTLLTTQFQLLQGQRSISETYTFAEPIILIASDDAGNAPAATEVITILPGDPAEVQLSSNPQWVGGNKHATVTARVVDEFDNGVPDEPVIFSVISGMGTLTPIDSATASDGSAIADFHSPREPEIGRIRATSKGLSAELDIETALVDPSLLGGSVTNYPNPFHPGEAPTTIAYKLTDSARVSLKIYSLTGRLVFEDQRDEGDPGGTAGLNEYQWDGRNGRGDVVASGGYILVIEAVRNGETIHKMNRKIAVVQ